MTIKSNMAAAMIANEWVFTISQRWYITKKERTMSNHISFKTKKYYVAPQLKLC